MQNIHHTDLSEKEQKKNRKSRGPGFNSPTGPDFFHYLNSVYVC